ncbi:MAG: hypothetical protein IPI23_16590 [Bacteroidetes bacterium]|nr:hypothetical protein [Bacteroidota bacterium]
MQLPLDLAQVDTSNAIVLGSITGVNGATFCERWCGHNQAFIPNGC